VSDRSHGDLRGDLAAAEARRRSLVDLPWHTLAQVHGARVVIEDGSEKEGPEEADAVVTVLSGRAIAVLGADCPLVGFASPEGVLGAAHAGWRGLVAGVLEETVEVMRSLGATRLVAILGPCIHPECYPFGVTDLDAVAARLGPAVRAETATGLPALDLPAGVGQVLAKVGVEEVREIGPCTACDPRFFSYRARGDEGRHALVLWREDRDR